MIESEPGRMAFKPEIIHFRTTKFGLYLFPFHIFSTFKAINRFVDLETGEKYLY